MTAFAIAAACCAACDTPNKRHPTPQRVQEDEPPVTAQQFAQEFYDWYAPIGLRDEATGPAWYAAFSRTPPLLSADLLRELRADSMAQSQAEGEIVGLNFDPFLNSQDPCARYEAAPGSGDAGIHRIPVHAVCAGSRRMQPDVIVEVAKSDGRWVIQNFVYPAASTDLRSQLNLLHRISQ